jgi:hypothetical protein
MTYSLPARYLKANLLRKISTPISYARVQVCKSFFMASLDIKKKFISYNIRNKIQKDGLFVEGDKRRRQPQSRRLVNQATLDSMRSFITVRMPL